MQFISKLFKPKAVVAGLAIAIGLVFGYNVITNNVVRALPQDCDSNSIIWCGFQNLGEFKNKYNKNDKGDLKTIYNHFGLQSDELNKFVNEGKMGYAHKNGDIIVDGQKVITGAQSLGREKFNGQRESIKIGGKTYYHSPTNSSFASEKIPVFVMFDDKGAVEFAVLNSCGNPIWGKKVTPEYSCDKLKKTAVEGKKNTYRFSTEATVKNNAKIEKVIYDFGDGSPTVEKKNPGDTVEHTYNKPGNYTAKVTVIVSLPGGKKKSVSGTQCQTTIKVEKEKKPVFVCKELAFAPTNRKNEYIFTVTSEQADGPKLAKADFDFGDGQTANGIESTDGQTVTVTHQYAENTDGEVTIKAGVYADAGQKDLQNSDCTIKIDFGNPPVFKECPEKPGSGLPVGHPDCEEKEEPKEVLPAEIVKTGPAEIIGSALGLSGIAGAGMYYRASRRNLIDTILKR